MTPTIERTPAPDIPGKRPLTPTLAWTLFWTAASGVGLGLLSLLYAFGLYDRRLFGTYLRHPLILLLNVLPVVLLVFLFY